MKSLTKQLRDAVKILDAQRGDSASYADAFQRVGIDEDNTVVTTGLDFFESGDENNNMWNLSRREKATMVGFIAAMNETGDLDPQPTEEEVEAGEPQALLDSAAQVSRESIPVDPCSSLFGRALVQ